MCKTQTDSSDSQQLPMNVGPGTLDGLSGPLDSVNSGPTTANVTSPHPSTFGRILELASMGGYDPTGGVDTGKFNNAKPTKFGALLSVVRPMMEGGTIGAFEGRSTPQGGFGAAQNFFLQQRMMQMQRNQFLMNMMKEQSEIGKNQAETQWAYRRPMITRPAPAIKGTDESGNTVYMSQNPQTAAWEEIPGMTPPGQTPDFGTVPTNRGIVLYDRHGVQKGAVPLSLADQAESAIASGSGESASAPSKAAQGTGSQSPEGVKASVPLMPPSFGKAKPGRVTNRNAAGNETDNLIDENPDSPTFGQTLKGNVASRAPVPDRTGPGSPKSTETADAETIAGKLLDKTGNDPDKALAALNGLKISDPAHAKYYEQLAPQIRKAIRDRVKPGRTGKQPRRLNPDDAKALGLQPSQSSMTGDEDEDENQ